MVAWILIMKHLMEKIIGFVTYFIFKDKIKIIFKLFESNNLTISGFMFEYQYKILIIKNHFS
jgi:hypothetical protein